MHAWFACCCTRFNWLSWWNSQLMLPSLEAAQQAFASQQSWQKGILNSLYQCLQILTRLEHLASLIPTNTDKSIFFPHRKLTVACIDPQLDKAFLPNCKYTHAIIRTKEAYRKRCPCNSYVCPCFSVFVCMYWVPILPFDDCRRLVDRRTGALRHAWYSSQTLGDCKLHAQEHRKRHCF